MKIAIIGAGIAGLAAAWRLGQRNDITLFERHASPGMAAHGATIGEGPNAPRVDVPLRVFYPGYYPQLTALYRAAGIESEPVDYSSTLHDAQGTPYFGYRNLLVGPLAIPLPLRRSFLGSRGRRIVRDLLRLQRQPTAGLGERSIGELLATDGYSAEFRDGFLLPAFATICTCSYENVLAFPAFHVVDYLTRGVFLTSVRRARGGAADVVRRLIPGNAQVRCGVDVRAVEASLTHVEVSVDGAKERFDHVVIATQANHVLKLFTNATDEERTVLSAFRYERVDVVMHTDQKLLPPLRRHWGSVNLMVSPTFDRPMSTIWMNAVQPELRSAEPVFQTVHPLVEPAAEKVIASARFERSVVDVKSARALGALDALQRQPGRRVWFCGSYARPGIPLLESAVASSERVADALRFRT